MKFLLALVVSLVCACGDNEPPTCASLGCAPDLACTRTGICTCNGQTCQRDMPTHGVDAGIDAR